MIITLEGWTDVMYMVRQAAGSPAYDFFFILCVIFGSFFVLNLMIAVQFSSLDTAPPDTGKKEGKDDDDNTED